MYKSPIDIVYGQMETQIEGDIFKAVQSYHINVDKEELIRALQYDRNQYDKGYADAKEELVRCKDCKHWKLIDSLNPHRECQIFYGLHEYGYLTGADDFCSYGERKDNGE